MYNYESDHIAFIGNKVVAEGQLADVATQIKTLVEESDGSEASIAPLMALIFEKDSGRQIDIELSGSKADVRKRFSLSSPDSINANDFEDASGRKGSVEKDNASSVVSKKPGRPRLGVVGREITLLPRHWQWLDRQRGGASASLRRLVEKSSKVSSVEDGRRQAQDRTNRFVSAMAGNLAGFEEATRALFTGRELEFRQHMASWPKDIQATALEFAALAFTTDDESSE